MDNYLAFVLSAFIDSGLLEVSHFCSHKDKLLIYEAWYKAYQALIV